jgi:hypothetical protein
MPTGRHPKVTAAGFAGARNHRQSVISAYGMLSPVTGLPQLPPIPRSTRTLTRLNLITLNHLPRQSLTSDACLISVSLIPEHYLAVVTLSSL